MRSFEWCNQIFKISSHFWDIFNFPLDVWKTGGQIFGSLAASGLQEHSLIKYLAVLTSSGLRSLNHLFLAVWTTLLDGRSQESHSRAREVQWNKPSLSFPSTQWKIKNILWMRRDFSNPVAFFERAHFFALVNNFLEFFEWFWCFFARISKGVHP